MSEKYNVIQIGLGPMGKIIANLMVTRKNINLKAIVDIDPLLDGKNLNKILNIELDTPIKITSDLDNVLTKGHTDVVFIATSSSLEKVAPLIKKAIEKGANVISICEELSYPFEKYPKLSSELDALAKSFDKSIIGTGINPGYLMDILPIAITAPCQQVNSIKVTRMMNSAKRREPFQRKIGTGLSPEQFHKKISNKEITGHVGLIESMQMIASALGWDYDNMEEFSPEEIITEQDFTTSYREVIQKGSVRGLHSKAITKKEGAEIITLDFYAYAGDHEEYDSIEIDGVPSLHQKIIGGVHGDIGTSAMVVNLIPKVVNARSGLLTMKDVSVPCNTANIYKK